MLLNHTWKDESKPQVKSKHAFCLSRDLKKVKTKDVKEEENKKWKKKIVAKIACSVKYSVLHRIHVCQLYLRGYFHYSRRMQLFYTDLSLGKSSLASRCRLRMCQASTNNTSKIRCKTCQDYNHHTACLLSCYFPVIQSTLNSFINWQNMLVVIKPNII